eukprot:198204-Rhodomonas_salina.1
MLLTAPHSLQREPPSRQVTRRWHFIPLPTAPVNTSDSTTCRFDFEVWTYGDATAKEAPEVVPQTQPKVRFVTPFNRLVGAVVISQERRLGEECSRSNSEALGSRSRVVGVVLRLLRECVVGSFDRLRRLPPQQQKHSQEPCLLLNYSPGRLALSLACFSHNLRVTWPSAASKRRRCVHTTRLRALPVRRICQIRRRLASTPSSTTTRTSSSPSLIPR